MVDMTPSLAAGVAARGVVVLNLEPRGVPLPQTREDQSAATQNIRAWVIGKTLACMRAGDILRGVDLLAARPDVDPGFIRAAARDEGGVWLLLAAATDPRLGGIWIDRTPHSLRAALQAALTTHELHDAVIPGFALHWDLNDLVKAIAPRKV